MDKNLDINDKRNQHMRRNEHLIYKRKWKASIL